MNRSAPLIFEYLDVVSYLQDYYQWRKSLSADFSYELLASELQFKSRSYVRMVFLGKKKISALFLQAFSDLNCGTEKEKMFFELLVNYSQTKNRAEKDVLGRKLSQILRNTLLRQDVLAENKGFVSAPLMPQLFTLLTFRDVHKTSENLAELLGLNLETTEQALSSLRNLNLIDYDLQQNQWIAKFEFFKVPDDKGNFDLLSFHKMSLDNAISAFTMPKEVRRFESLLLPMSESELKAFYDQLDEFFQLQLSTLRSQTLKGRRLFQLNFNIHPFTREAVTDEFFPSEEGVTQARL